MSSANPKDFLSAFYDREATSDEEAAAKALVDRLPEASREVRDYRRLSRLLQDLPRVAVPPEFAGAVMQRAERESLIPLDPVAPTVAAQPRRRPWALAISASVTVAASLLIAAAILNWPSRRHAAQQFAVREPVTSSEAAVVRTVSIGGRKELDAERKDGLALAKVVGKRSTALGATIAKTIDSGSKIVSKAKAFVSRDSPVAAPGQTPAASATPMSTSSLGKDAARDAEGAALILPANLKTAKVGDVVEALQQDGEQVAVVRLTVVNQVEGLDGVQSVLMHNTSRRLQNADEIKRMRQKFVADNAAEVSKAELPTPQGDMICVYAEGSRDEMLRVLQDLQNESHIQKAELTNTIAFTMLEKYASHAVPPNKQSQELTAARLQVANGPVAQSSQSPGSQMAVSLPASTVDKIFSARRPTSQGRQSQSATPGLVAQQAPAERDAASLEWEERLGKKGASADQTQANKSAPRGVQSRAAGSQVAKQDDRSRMRDSKEVVAAPKSFQIFFVITDQAPTPQAPTSQAPVSQAASGKSAAASKDRSAPVQAAPAPAKPRPPTQSP